MTERRAIYKVKVPQEPEKDIGEKIDQLLVLEGWQVFAFAQPGAHGRLGGIAPEGWADRLAVKGKRLFEEMLPTYLHLEYKRPGEALKPKQKIMKARLEAEGCLFFRVESLEDMAAILRGLGYTLRTGIRP